MLKRRGRLLFVNKKKQKNFIRFDRACVGATVPNEQKFFAPLFFLKRRLALSARQIARKTHEENPDRKSRGNCRPHHPGLP
jgi:hypothetical protein